VAKRTREHDFPDKDTANRVFTHNLTALTKLALPESVTEEMERSKGSPLYKNWLIAKDGNEKARYKQIIEEQVRGLHQAIIDPDHGVLAWIRNHW